MPAATRTPLSMARLPYAEPGWPDLRSGDRFILWLARLQRATLAAGAVFGILWMGFQAVIPGTLGMAIQSAADGDRRGVVVWAGAALAAGVLQAVAGILRHRMAVTNWIGAASRLQQIVARRAAALGGDISRQVATGEVVAVTANDVERIGAVFDMSARLAGALVSFAGVSVALLLVSPTLGVVVLIGVPVLTLVIGPLMRPLERREAAQRRLFGAATELAADVVAGLRVLRGIGGEDVFVDRFRARSQDVRAAAVRVARIRSLLDALQVALPGTLVVIVTAVGASLAMDGRIDVGELVAFYGYTAFLVLPLRTVTEFADKLVRGRVSARRVVAVLSLERLTHHAVGPETEPGLPGRLSDPARGIEVMPGALTGIVCADPRTSGELAEALCGHVDGSAELSGVPLAALPLDVTRRRLLLHDKDPAILSGRVGDLLDVPGSGRVSVADAVAAASADDIIDGLGGWDALLPERGRTLSGGQRQRLSLARSFVADPDVLVLDEPTSAVDAHTEADIARNLRAIRAGRTTVVLTTSPVVLEQCDRVLWAPDGSVVAAGTHRDLAREPGYRWTVSRLDDSHGSDGRSAGIP